MAAGLYDITNETLGKGHFAVVKLARHCLTGELVAVKIIDKSKLNNEGLQQLGLEIRLLSRLSEHEHPNIVKLYQVIDTKTKLYLVMEYCGRDVCDLYDYIQKRYGGNGLKESEAKHIFGQICSAIAYCHSLRIVHRDLKPENILIVTQSQEQIPSPLTKYPVVKLIDFGFSNQWGEGEKLRTSCGSLAYSAPEILLGDHYDGDKVDIWGLGCILYILLYGNNPFMQLSDSETLCKILDCTFSTPPRPTITDSAILLIKSLLKRDPTSRLTIKQMLAVPWIADQEEGAEATLEEDPVEETVQPKSNISKQKVVRNVHEKVVDQMITHGMCSSRDHVERALKSSRDHVNSSPRPETVPEEESLDNTVNGEKGHDGVGHDNYITATYHLLKDKLLREIHGTTTTGGISGSSSSNAIANASALEPTGKSHHRRGPVLPSKPRKQLIQQAPRFRPGLVLRPLEEPSSANDSDNATVSPQLEMPIEDEISFSLPLQRKCSIVSEEGSCSGTDGPCHGEGADEGGLHMPLPQTRSVSGSRVPVDIVVTDYSDLNEVQGEVCREEEEEEGEGQGQGRGKEKEGEDEEDNDRVRDTVKVPSRSLGSTALHLVSSSPELLRDQDFNGYGAGNGSGSGNGNCNQRQPKGVRKDKSKRPATMILSDEKCSHDDIGKHVLGKGFGQTGNGQTASGGIATSMRVIVQSKSCNNILFNEENEVQGKSKKSGSQHKSGIASGCGQLIKRNKGDRTDCCTIC